MPSLSQIAQALGLYRPARWIQLHTVRRDALENRRRNERFYGPLVRGGDLVFDVGANRGDLTEAFLRLGARVIAFEPQEAMRRTIQARMGSRDDLVIEACALGREPGTAELFVNERHTGSSSLLPEWPEDVSRTRVVLVSTLDAMIEKHGLPRYIKVDVEGFELEVLSGLSRHVPLISFEHTRDHPEGPKKVRGCVEHLCTLGRDVEINITPAEHLTFTLTRWVPAAEFLEMYPGRFSEFQYRYGDIFVRSAAKPQD